MSRRARCFSDSMDEFQDTDASATSAAAAAVVNSADRNHFRALSNDSFIDMTNWDASDVRQLWANQSSRSNTTLVAMSSRSVSLEEDFADKEGHYIKIDSAIDSPGNTPDSDNSNLNAENLADSLLYGVINSILTIPFGYAAIIFSHPDFATFMPSLSKLVMLSNVVHQVMFTLLSSLPFAIGQVQDAGLIFLGAMATSIYNSLGGQVPLEAKVTTVVVCLVLLGRFRLAGLVSYVSMPVIGGYLAYIGLFCFYAGLSQSAGFVADDVSSLLPILESWENVLLCVPGIIGGFLLVVASQRCKSSLALPACILGPPIVFYALLPITGYSMDEAREGGLITPATPLSDLAQMWNLFDFSQVYWPEVPKQIPTWLGMVFVVAFSSCLGVVVIEMDMGQQLDINRELSSVGWSNVVSGLLGGYTGSYIFSQTIFTYRSGTNSRVVGVCVTAAEVAVVLLPLSAMSFLPRFFFAATLIFVAIDLLNEWLVKVYRKLLPREYVVLWLSFLAINCVSLELGILLGIGFAVLNFLFGYATTRVATRKTRSSPAVRKYAARTVLAKKRGAIVYLELCGDLFFASSVQILEDAQKAVLVRKTSGQFNSSDNHTFSQMAKRYLSTLLGRVGGRNGGQNCPQSSLPMTHLTHVVDSPHLECLDGSSPAHNAQTLPT